MMYSLVVVAFPLYFGSLSLREATDFIVRAGPAGPIRSVAFEIPGMAWHKTHVAFRNISSTGSSPVAKKLTYPGGGLGAGG